jgi:hypothetical protein
MHAFEHLSKQSWCTLVGLHGMLGNLGLVTVHEFYFHFHPTLWGGSTITGAEYLADDISEPELRWCFVLRKGNRAQ